MLELIGIIELVDFVHSGGYGAPTWILVRRLDTHNGS